ncbi:unnamed protein product [Closterium sp. NIES-54]
MISKRIRPSSQIRRLSRRAADMAGVYTPSTWTKVAAVSGAAAVGLGAYGAHAFKPENPVYKEVWRTGNLYHLVHSAALLASPLVKRPDVVSSQTLQFKIVALWRLFVKLPIPVSSVSLKFSSISSLPSSLLTPFPLPFSFPLSPPCSSPPFPSLPSLQYGSLLTFGIVAFSGSCYLSAAYEDRALGVGAPFGGFAFIGAWLSAAF